MSFLTKLTQLKILRLWRNKLSEVPKGLEKLTKLNVLSLGGNQLTKVPKELENLTQLTTLYLNRNQLTEDRRGAHTEGAHHAELAHPLED